MKNSVFIAILVIFGFLLYFNSLKNGFAYDDISLIKENNAIADFDKGLSSLFNHEYFLISQENTYRPVATLTYLVNYRLWKTNPFGYHLFSILLHLLSTVFLFLLIKRLFFNNILSFIVSLLYSANPVLTEAVNCATFNEDILAALFFILAFIFYHKYSYAGVKKIVYYFLSFFFLFLAFFSKEISVTFLPLIIIYDAFFFDAKKNFKERSSFKNLINAFLENIKSKKYIYLGYFALTLFYLFMLFVVFDNPFKSAPRSFGSLGERIMYIPYLYFQFLSLTIFPVRLIVERDFSYPLNFLDPVNIASSLILIALFLIIFYYYKYNKISVFGLLWFLITLIPVLNIIEINHPVAERFLYLPSVGFVLFAVSSAFDLFKFIKNRKIVLSVSIFIIVTLLFLYSYRVINRNKRWKDNFTLWSYANKKYPDNPRVKNNLGVSLAKRGRYDKALNMFLNAIELDPEYKKPYLNIGNVYKIKKEYDDAIFYYKKAIKINNEYYPAYSNLISVLLMKGSTKEAQKYLIKLITLYPQDVESMDKLASLYIMQNKTDKALDLLKQALEIKSDYPKLYYNLGLAHYIKNELSAALKNFNYYIKLEPHNPKAYNITGEIYGKLGFFEDAERNIKLAIRYEPLDPSAHLNLGIVYANQNKIQEAINEWEIVLTIDPDNKNAKEFIESIK